MHQYGKYLIELRGDKTQEKVAKDIGIATSTLGMYELEQRVPRDEIKIKLANYYGKSVQEIFFESKCHEKGQLQDKEVVRECQSH